MNSCKKYNQNSATLFSVYTFFHISIYAHLYIFRTFTFVYTFFYISIYAHLCMFRTFTIHTVNQISGNHTAISGSVHCLYRQPF